MGHCRCLGGESDTSKAHTAPQGPVLHGAGVTRRLGLSAGVQPIHGEHFRRGGIAQDPSFDDPTVLYRIFVCIERRHAAPLHQGSDGSVVLRLRPHISSVHGRAGELVRLQRAGAEPVCVLPRVAAFRHHGHTRRRSGLRPHGSALCTLPRPQWSSPAPRSMDHRDDRRKPRGVLRVGCAAAVSGKLHHALGNDGASGHARARARVRRVGGARRPRSRDVRRRGRIRASRRTGLAGRRHRHSGPLARA